MKRTLIHIILVILVSKMSTYIHLAIQYNRGVLPACSQYGSFPGYDTIELHSLRTQDLVSDLLFESELQLFSSVLVASLTECNLLLLKLMSSIGPRKQLCETLLNTALLSEQLIGISNRTCSSCIKVSSSLVSLICMQKCQKPY